jgi:hypothetical protein
MEDSKLIDEMGGTSSVARLTGLTSGAISQWRTNGIPKPWMMYFRVLRPKLFAKNDNKRKAAP